MKVCPYCSAQNQDRAAVCYYCRGDLSGVTPAPAPNNENQERTQPFRVTRPQSPSSQQRSIDPSDTQPMHGQRQGGTNPNQAPYPPAPGNPPSQPYYQPPPSQPYYHQQPAAPAQTPPASRQRSTLWIVLAVSALFVLLCIGGFTIWTISQATIGEIGWLGGRSATEQAGGGLVDPTSAPVVPAPLDTPTPWPTFTSPPVDTLPPPTDTQVPDATEDPAITKLLSPECSAALETLETLSGQITENPTAPLNADWRKELSDAIANMRTYCGTLENASPVPGILEEAQRNLALASSEFDQATALFNEGVETWSPGKLLEAAQHIGKASEHLRIALAELRKIGR